MGLTIHFQGNLKNTNIVYQFIDELRDISRTMNWDWQVLDEDWSKPSTAKISTGKKGIEITGHLSLKGISINVHPKCESLSFFFTSEGTLVTPISVVLFNEGTIERENINSSVKTQFAPPEVHITIIELLKYLKKRYIPDLKVIDEGEYWESGDKDRLIEKKAFLDEKMDLVAGILSEIKIENAENCSPEQLAAIIEERLKKRL